MVWATSQIDDYTENNKTGDCDDLDGSAVISEYEIGYSTRYARKDKFRLAVCASTEHINGDDDDKTHDNPY
jgi:hypothetical protein